MWPNRWRPSEDKCRQRQTEREGKTPICHREGGREGGRDGERETICAVTLNSVYMCVRDCSRGVSSVKPHPSVVLGLSEREAVMVSGGECVKEEARERRRRENREELVRQLEEATLSDKKERLKVIFCTHVYL